MSDRDAIGRVRQAFITAFNDEDADGMAACMAEDNVAMPPNRPALRGTEASRAFWIEGWSVAASTFVTDSERLEIAGDVAIDQFHWTMESVPKDGGERLHDAGKCVWIWRREPDGSWRLALSIWNSSLSSPGLWTGAGPEI